MKTGPSGIRVLSHHNSLDNLNTVCYMYVVAHESKDLNSF
jgi:hypothetical protein